MSLSHGAWAAAGLLVANVLPLLLQLPLGRSAWCWASDNSGGVVTNPGAPFTDKTAAYYSCCMNACGSTSQCSPITYYCYKPEQCKGATPADVPPGDDALASVSGRAESCATTTTRAPTTTSLAGSTSTGTGDQQASGASLSGLRAGVLLLAVAVAVASFP
mmetsp:Transcript_46144/g.103768  ORF Transcript_46144/g.103768 Transcript_46144/m.103768 type:complete len:161 (-) Transcript_46144:125-607(-)